MEELVGPDDCAGRFGDGLVDGGWRGEGPPAEETSRFGMRTEKRLDPLPRLGVVPTGLVEISGAFLMRIPRDGFVENGVDVGLIGCHQTVSIQTSTIQCPVCARIGSRFAEIFRKTT